MARAAVFLRRRIVFGAVDVRGAVNGKGRFGLVGAPDKGTHPVILGPRPVPLDQARLQQHTVTRELLPELGPDRKDPVVHLAGVDLRARR
jgi:hypothetical protein